MAVQPGDLVCKTAGDIAATLERDIDRALRAGHRSVVVAGCGMTLGVLEKVRQMYHGWRVGWVDEPGKGNYLTFEERNEHGE